MVEWQPKFSTARQLGGYSTFRLTVWPGAPMLEITAEKETLLLEALNACCNMMPTAYRNGLDDRGVQLWAQSCGVCGAQCPPRWADAWDKSDDRLTQDLAGLKPALEAWADLYLDCSPLEASIVATRAGDLIRALVLPPAGVDWSTHWPIRDYFAWLARVDQAWERQ